MAGKSSSSRKSKASKDGFVNKTEARAKAGGNIILPPKPSPAPAPQYVGSLAEQEQLALHGLPRANKDEIKERYDVLQEKVRLQEQKNSMIYGLPHRYGWKWYPWAREFFENRNKLSFLCAANQISKSSTQIRKCIEWATNKEIWPQLWAREPNLFWYLYPERGVATAEFKLKWEREFLPRGEFREHPHYGWTAFYKRGEIDRVEFNSGVTVHFKTYAQDVQNLQTGTVYAVFCFAAGTKIRTPTGERSIEKLVPGDWVETHSGPRRVVRATRALKEVQTRTIGGRRIKATPDHPFWTQNRGWVQFGALTESDECVQLPQWQGGRQESLGRSRLCYSRESSTPETPRLKTLGSGGTLGTRQENSSTLPYGKPTQVKRFLGATSSTTKTKTPSTTLSRIWRYSPAPRIREFTKWLSGAPRKPFLTFAPFVEKILFPGAVNELSRGIAPSLADEGRTDAKQNVCAAVENFLHEKILAKSFVLNSAPTEKEVALVYNIEVEQAHTYFAEGTLVHNCDEELPEEHYSELGARLNASDGYFSMVFTATLGQDIWRRCMEPDNEEEEVFPEAYKSTVSLYEAMHYEDGSPSHWTPEKIAVVKAKCKSHDEIQKRVYGRFLILEGRKYPTFDASRHLKAHHIVPSSWPIYHGADPGSGGEHGHPAALCYVAVSPDFRQGRVFLGWRGDKIETTNDFLVKKHIELKTTNKLEDVMQYYDHANKDFEMTARGLGETYLKAEKSHEVGEGLLNTLFKNDMLFLYDTEDGELSKLARELSTLKDGQSKKHAKDDFTDALRYAVAKIPWDLSGITGKVSEYTEPDPEITDPAKLQDMERRGVLFEAHQEKDYAETIEDEFAEANDLAGGY